MSRNLTTRFLAETELAIARAVSIADVTRIAHSIARSTRPSFDDAPTTEIPFSYDELRWFRRPIGGGL